MDWERTLSIVLALVDRASVLVKDAYDRNDTRVDYKSPGDPVTDADRAANSLLCDGLADAFPDAAIVGEESTERARGDRKTAALSFFVDPIDGTRDYVERTGMFVVMVGLVVEGKAMLSVIQEPASGRCFAAAPGAGAFELASGRRKPIRVSAKTDTRGARLLVSRTRPSQKRDDLAKRLGFESIKLGSSGYKGARVANGEADAFLHLNMAGCLWDAAPADAIVTAAGGRFTDQFGQPFDYAQADFANPRGVVGANERLHSTIIEALQNLP